MATEVLRPIRLRTHLYKACKRCGGDLRLERSADSRLGEPEYDYACLQCGRHISLASLIAQLREAKSAA